MHYNLVWNSHWIINPLLQCKCLKTTRELKIRSASASWVCTHCTKLHLKHFKVPLATRHSAAQCHLANIIREVDAPARNSRKSRKPLLNPDDRQAQGRLQNEIQRGRIFVKNRKLLLSHKSFLWKLASTL